MRNRIAMWAGAGFVVAAFWVLYAFVTFPVTTDPTQGLRLLAAITCPITLAGHHPIGLSWVLVANAVTYALVGLIVEIPRKYLIRPRTHHV